MKQKPRQWVQLYYDKLEILFTKGNVKELEHRWRFLSKLRILNIVKNYANMEALLCKWRQCSEN